MTASMIFGVAKSERRAAYSGKKAVLALICLGVAGLCGARGAQGAVSFGATPSPDTAYSIQFMTIGQTNPTYTFHSVPEIGDLQVSFGTHFVGQSLGPDHNSLADTSPIAPLALANGPGMGVQTQFDLSHLSGPVLGGFQGATKYTTPLAILFDAEVNFVAFDLGHLDATTPTLVQAYDAAGNSLGVFGNLPLGHNRVTLVESTQTNTIAGISIYVPTGAMDWEGFAISDIEFGLDNSGDPQIPEPASIVVWSILGVVGLASAWYKKHR